jgi:multiple sugar transport system permease protein
MANVAVPAATQREAAPAASEGGLTDRAKSERKLAYILCAPAVLVMVLVAGFPILYAFYLSLRRADLRFPDAGKWVGLHNYIAVL